MIRLYPVLPHISGQSFRFVTLLLLLVSFSSHASDNLHMIPLSLEERVKAAEMIVEGEVIAQRSFWDAGHSNIYTSNTIRVYKVFKGELQPKEIELITAGGTVDLERHVFSAALQLHGGQQGVFFLVQEPQLRLTSGSSGFTGSAYGGKQGFIRYDLHQLTATDVFISYEAVSEVYSAVTARTGKTFREIAPNNTLQDIVAPAARIQNNVLAPVINSFSPLTASAGTGTVLTINGSGFGSVRGNGAVRFRNGDDGGKTTVEPYASDYLQWTDTQIRVKIPSYGTSGSPAGSGRIELTTGDGVTVTSSSNITINFVYSNVIEEGGTTPTIPILINKNNQGGYTIRFGPNMDSRSLAKEGFRRAMNSWVCNTDVNWRIGSSTTIGKIEKDGVNVILFTQTSTNTLAQTISRYSGCRNLTTNEITWWVDEFDMEINQSINWQYGPGPPTGNQFDFETVILHELGHAHQLGHVIQPNASVMHYAVAIRTEFRKLIPADVLGGRLVMESSFDPAKVALAALCNVRPTTRNTEGECNLAQEFVIVDALYTGTGEVEVVWSTIDERFILSFTIERSPDGSTWTPIGSVVPSVAGTYVFTDSDPLEKISFYRIRITYSNSNTLLYSSKMRVISPDILYMFSLYPNPTSPFQEAVKLEYIVRQDTRVTMWLYNSAGKLIKEAQHIFTGENLPYTLQINELASGLYILKWSSSNNRSGTVKLIKL